MISTLLPENAPLTLHDLAAHADAYVHALRQWRGYGEAECAKVEEALAALILEALSAYVSDGRTRGPAMRSLLSSLRGRSAKARARSQALGGLLGWIYGEAEPLTDERIAELASLAHVPNSVGTAVPRVDDVDLLLKTPNTKTDAGLNLSVAMYLAAYRGLEAPEICELRAGAIDWSRQVLFVRSQPEYSFDMDEWEQHSLGLLTRDLSPDAHVLRTRGGQPLRPRYLQQQVARCVAPLAERLSEPLTLERLRDHAARWCLDHGGTFGEVARMLGFTRVANARRRFGREPWEYLADRASNWFTIEASAEAEGLSPDLLQRWGREGLPHEVRGSQTYVRKEDVRAFRVRPASTVRSPGAVLGGIEVASPQATSSGPGVELLSALFGGPDAPDASGTLGQLQGLRALWATEPHDQLSALSGGAASIFARLIRLQKTQPELASAERVRLVLGEDGVDLSRDAVPDLVGLRAVLMRSTVRLDALDRCFQSVDFDNDPPSIATLISSQLNSPLGVEMLEEALGTPQGRWAFWSLVDQYLKELSSHWRAAETSYGMLKDQARKLRDGCLLYAFFASVVAASPDVEMRPEWSGQGPETVLFEALRHWLVITLNACDALRTGPKRELWLAPSITFLSDQQEFAVEFERRWREAMKRRRGPWSFRVVPTVNVFDIVRYADLTFSAGALGSPTIARRATGHLLYLSKLPPERLFVPADLIATKDLQQALLWAYRPLMEAEYRKTVTWRAQQREADPENLAEQIPLELEKALYRVFYLAWAKFRLPSVASGEAVELLTDASRAFAAYLLPAVQRCIRSRCRDVAVELSHEEFDEGTGGDVEERDGGEDQNGQGAPGVREEWRDEEHADVEDGGEDQKRREGDCATETAEASFTVKVPVIRNREGLEYMTVYWASRLCGVDERWLQRHAAELGAVRASDAILTAGERLDHGLSAQAWLLPDDPDLRYRVQRLREQGGAPRQT